MKKIFFYKTYIGRIGIIEEGSFITNLYFQRENIPQDVVVYETELLKEAGEQLQSYLLGRRKKFTLPLALSGTDFLLCVWKSICTIPYGETRSYQKIAQSIGNKNASRAIGLASNHNPIPILIPCHRVIGSNGKLTGYRLGLQIKAHLLELEKQNGDL
jgi:methylated-DNA-[protein]-cysteine S-methyltransferase